MKNSVILVILLFLAGCNEISFKEPQPRGKKTVKQIPKNMWGSYIPTDEKGTPEDTLFITSTGYRVGHKPEDNFVLSDSLVLKYYKGYYFINVQDDTEWFLRILKREKNGDLLFIHLGNGDEPFSSYLNSLSSEIKIDSFEVGEKKLYQIDPTPQQLISIISKTGLVKQTMIKKVRVQ
jgi:hypothetical protein